jgi:hypothetical protein
MFSGLGFNTLVCSHHQKYESYATEPGKRVVKEFFMTGYVYESELKIIDLQVCKAQVNRDAPSLLLDPPIAVNSGQGLHQLGFAVIDVTGSADGDGSHGVDCLLRRLKARVE